MMNADRPERLRIRVKDRKQITPDEKVPLELSDHESELILKHTFADDDLTGPFCALCAGAAKRQPIVLPWMIWMNWLAT